MQCPCPTWQHQSHHNTTAQQQRVHTYQQHPWCQGLLSSGCHGVKGHTYSWFVSTGSTFLILQYLCHWFELVHRLFFALIGPSISNVPFLIVCVSFDYSLSKRHSDIKILMTKPFRQLSKSKSRWHIWGVIFIHVGMSVRGCLIKLSVTDVMSIVTCLILGHWQTIFCHWCDCVDILSLKEKILRLIRPNGHPIACVAVS